MATAVTSAAAPAVAEQGPHNSSASPVLANNQQHAPPNGSSTPGVEGVMHPGLRLDMRNANGPQRDGRVRNPIPSKLKGKTDEKKGNFNVMHMDISNASESQARYDAAKRSSESTALQAKMAETDHYVSHHRRANYARTKGGTDSATPAPTPPLPPRTQQLTPEEVKAEQARLLTLLRTLPHANIVDQICKALAFFGGIPDAPPPQDGKFPDSGEANGAGSLFVGWLSEIFPDLEHPRRPVIQLSAPPKRPRGRPKGSKASKARRDKGMKKGKAGDGTASLGPGADQQDGEDEGWEDMNDSILDVDRAAESVETRVLTLLRTPPQSSAVPTALPATGGSTGFTSINPAAADSASSNKKRGRPKGSKNRPKEPGAPDTPQQVQHGPTTVPTTAATFQLPADVVSAPTTIVTETNKKPTGGRSKGGKKKNANTSIAQGNNTTAQHPPAPQVGTSTTYIPPPTLPLAATRPAMAVAAPAQIVTNGNTSKAKRTQLPSQIQAPNAHQSSEPAQGTPPVKESTITGAKRKRQSNKPTVNFAGTDGTAESTGIGPSSSLPGPLINPVLDASTTAQSQSHVGATIINDGATNPPPKRSRKSQAGATKRKSTAALSSDVTTSISVAESLPPQRPNQTNDTTAPIAQTRQPAGGLAAHYERFASLQSSDQNQPYSSQQQQQQQQTPTTTAVTSSAPASGLEAHYERFAALQNHQQSPQQSTGSRQQPRQVAQQATQSVSPAPSQISKSTQAATLPSQQQARTATNLPNYYAQSATPAFTIQQGSSYSTNQRQPQNTSTSSPGTALVSHVTHSPQYGAQSSNSPLLNNDNAFRGSPSLGFAPRRTTSASPMDNSYRTNNVTTQSFANTRQTPASSHSGVASGFASFPDNNFLDLQSFDSGGANSMGLGSTGPYNIGNGNVPRNNNASNASTGYANPTMTNGTYDQNGLNKGTMNTGYRNQPRWS
ncbi:hypothetical protein TruAng_005919 [Truncatella angustata]|nr:hypothetical protein TruAng_005919 [Truncatella angustata]